LRGEGMALTPSAALSGLGKTAPANPGRRSLAGFALGYFLSPRQG
jgi:hypothetical protein